MTTYYSTIDSPLGPLLLLSDGAALTGLYAEGQTRAPAPAPDWIRDDGAAPFAEAARQIAAYFRGERADFDLPLAPGGTAFQRRVWGEIARVPFGATASYGELARRVGSPGAARAVGMAAGRNPLLLVVPCHRVVGAGGALTGYAGGTDRKSRLLRHEAGGVGDAAPAVVGT